MPLRVLIGSFKRSVQSPCSKCFDELAYLRILLSLYARRVARAFKNLCVKKSRGNNLSTKHEYSTNTQ